MLVVLPAEAYNQQVDSRNQKREGGYEEVSGIGIGSGGGGYVHRSGVRGMRVSDVPEVREAEGVPDVRTAVQHYPVDGKCDQQYAGA